MNHMDEPIYELSIMTGPASISVYGPLSQLQPAFEHYRDGGYAGNRFTVEGFTNTADRAPMKVCLDPEQIIGMTLVRQY